MEPSIKQTVDYQVKKTTVCVTFADITTLDADALVSSDNNRLTMEYGVSRAILNAAGPEVREEVSKHAPLHMSDVAVTSAGQLPAKYIFHAVTVDFDKKIAPSVQSLDAVVRKCLQLADTLGARHIAFPTLGTGALGVPFQASAEIMTRAIVDYIQKGTRVTQVTIALFAPPNVEDSELCVFHGAMARLTGTGEAEPPPPPATFESLLSEREHALGSAHASGVKRSKNDVSTPRAAHPQLRANAARRLIPAMQSSERYALITFLAPKATGDLKRLPLNLSLVIDRSGSMSGNKLKYVKQAAIHALGLLSDEDWCSVVIYDDEVEVLAASQTMTNAARLRIIQQIQKVHTGGATNLNGGWIQGCEQVDAGPSTEASIRRVLLLTDGLANRGLTDHEELVTQAKALRKKGLSTTTFGVGADFNQFLLQGLADNGGGHFYFIDSPDQIANYFAGELGEMLTTVARDIVLEIDVPDGVTFDLLSDVPTEPLPHGVRLMLGDAYSGEARKIALKLKCPALDAERRLTLPLKLMYEDVQQQRMVPLEGALTLETVTSSKSDHQAVDMALLKEAVQIQVELVKLEAMKLEYKNDRFGAQQVLQLAADALQASLPTDVVTPYIEILQKEAAAIKKGRSEIARKTGHYTSYTGHHGRRDYKK